MFSIVKIPFKNSKEQTVRPFLCDRVKQFGFCKGLCLERHVLCKTLDKNLLNIPAKCLISIQLTKVLSASHFYGKILKYSTKNDPRKDEDWVGVEDMFDKINNELENIESSLDTLVLHKNPIIGEMVMVELTQGKFFRAVILDVVNGWFVITLKVKLIDLGRDEEINSNKVFELPSHLKDFRPATIEIIISSMEPIEEGDSVLNWPIGTTNLVKKLLEPIILSNLEFICKVELTLGVTLWVDWMLAKTCFKCTHFACKLYKNSLKLPKELIDRNIVKTTSKITDRLIELNKDACVWEEHPRVDKLKNESLTIQKPNMSLFSCEESNIKTDDVIQVQWAHLSENLISNVSVVYIEHPKCILVHNLEFVGRIDALQKDIDEVINSKIVDQLTCATVGTVCLAISPEGNKYNRVLIKEINDKIANVLYVDYGEFCQVKIDTLLTIPSNLITKLPFQAIECNLCGFKDILLIDDQFLHRFLEIANTNLYLKVISLSKDAKLTGGNYYEVVLFNDEMNLNITMANEFHMCIDNNQIQNITNLKYQFDETNNDECDEEIESQLEFLESLLKNSIKSDKKQIQLNSTDLSHDNKIYNTVKTDKKPTMLNSTEFIQDKIVNNTMETNEKQIKSNLSNFNQAMNISNEKEKDVRIIKKYCLNCNTTPVVPQCFWHQDDEWIYLKLSIISVNNYNITHTMDTIKINVETNSQTYYFTAILYAFIAEESFVCHVNFDGIRIKAKKLIQINYQWPRFLKCSKKHKYLIYDTECIVERKDLCLWMKLLNKFKMQSLGIPCNTIDYNSDFYDSDSSCNEYTIFEDDL